MPSTPTRTMPPSASWPIAPRAWRLSSRGDPNDSPAWKIGLPFWTSSGPPPIAAARPLQSGESESSTSTCWPTGASALSCGHRLRAARDENRAAGGIASRRSVVTCVTAPSSGVSSAAAGNEAEHRLGEGPDSCGVARAVHGRVERELRPSRPASSGHRAGAGPFPCQIPANETRPLPQRAVGSDAEARAPAGGRALEDAVLHEHAARRAAAVEVVAVDRHGRRPGGEPGSRGP